MIQGSVGEFLGFQTAWSQPLFPCALSGCDLALDVEQPVLRDPIAWPDQETKARPGGG